MTTQLAATNILESFIGILPVKKPQVRRQLMAWLTGAFLVERTGDRSG
jgi:hypothetical protein